VVCTSLSAMIEWEEILESCLPSNLDRINNGQVRGDKPGQPWNRITGMAFCFSEKREAK